MLQLPAKSPMVWQKFFSENKAMVYRYIVNTLKKAIIDGAPTADLFQFADGHVTNVAETNYKFMLDEAMKVFIQAEDYEYAAKVKRLYDLLHINKLLKEVSNGV